MGRKTLVDLANAVRREAGGDIDNITYIEVAAPAELRQEITAFLSGVFPEANLGFRAGDEVELLALHVVRPS